MGIKKQKPGIRFKLRRKSAVVGRDGQKEEDGGDAWAKKG